MLRRRALLVLPLALPAALPAAPARAQARSLLLSPANTIIGFSIGALGLFSVGGRFTRFTGDLVLDPADPLKTLVAVLVDTTSVESEGGATRAARARDLLRTRDFPTMAFRSLAVRPAEAAQLQLDGILTLAGVTHPLALWVRRAGGDLLADGVLDRSSHNLTALRPILSDRVRIAITVTLG